MDKQAKLMTDVRHLIEPGIKEVIVTSKRRYMTNAELAAAISVKVVETLARPKAK